jgi:Sulfate permease family
MGRIEMVHRAIFTSIFAYPDWSSGADVESGTPKRQTHWELIKTRSKYYIPGMSWIPNYSVSTYAILVSVLGVKLIQRGSLLGDVVAGITIASIIIPQSISYASSLAKLEPTTGLASSTFS